MQWSEARTLYPGLIKRTFLDAACVSLIPITTVEKIGELMQMALYCDSIDASANHVAMDDLRQHVSLKVAELFQVPSSRVALIESTTYGLNVAANIIPFESGDEILLPDTEFLQVAIPFVKKAEKQRLKIVPVQTPKNGFLSLSAFEEKINRNTKVICVSSVQWCTGQRLPMDALGKLCEDKGIWLVVDGVHEAGALSVNLENRYADFYIAGGHKWLNAPFGCGLMVLSKRALELSPCGYGYLSLPAPSEGWGAYFQNPAQTPFRTYTFPKVGKTFESGGTSNYPGAVALGESLRIVNALGIDRVEERIKGLAQTLRKELLKINCTVFSPEDPKMGSGITIFRVSDDPKKDRAILDDLLDKKICLSIRFTAGHGGFRVSTHYFNNEEDIMRLVEELKNYRINRA